MKFLRHYRLAADDFCPPTGNVIASRGQHLAEQAERDLRSLLADDPANGSKAARRG